MVFTTPLKHDSIKIMLLGSGELGKEVAIEASRLGVEVIAVDSYSNAPAHLVANRSYIVDMKNKEALLELIYLEKPTYIVPEIEALNIEALEIAENKGFNVIPNANAVKKTMNRKNIRKFVAEELGIKTSPYMFVSSYEELKKAAVKLGFPCVIKPIMSSSGHGQSIAKNDAELKNSWEMAKEARGDASELIVEGFINFDYEITLLNVRTEHESKFCEPIGHIQKDGDYILSWQPMPMKKEILEKAQKIAKRVTDGLGGRGIFGVELFIKGDEVYFSEVSPRPHDTGMVTMISQSQSEFALHVRAILGLPLEFSFIAQAASAAYKAEVKSENPHFDIPKNAFCKNSFIRIFGKPNTHKGRRMAVVLVQDEVEKAKQRAEEIAKSIKMTR
ncbi:MAG: formate-dependent phosphoribosylglycinamide formyltransferase [Campylobacteraceae bacterium]|jgi:phosphoribosylglycinamide formyltransferase 2|nr:formate-dependent phosphoribosylglycinamide formyltransferase [Campylobacteraceae bacterium]